MAKKSKGTLIRWSALVLILLGFIAFIVLDRQHDRSMTEVATVNGKPIYLYELEREVKNYYDQIGGTQRITDDNIDDLRVAVMDMLVEQKVVLLDAAKKGYVANIEEIDKSITDQKGQTQSQAEWEAFLSSWGFTEASFKQYMIEMYTVDKYPETQWNIPEVTEEMLYAEYLKRKETSPNLVYEETKDFIKTTMEIDLELQTSQAWYKALEESSKIKILDKRVLGRKAFAAEDYKAAISYYSKARKAEPEDAYIDVTIAKAYSALGDDAQFRKFFESAVKKDPNNTFVHMAFAKLLIEKGQNDEAAEEIRKSIAAADKTNMALLERIEEFTLQLEMNAEADQLDLMIRELMMPSITSTTP
ncbi:MAG TPA: SurA N-terminal domain-containing protein [Bacillota bacterium]|mgnify:FL=1|nr:SurA N-terminal domain-containing protein [Bacillota bacterium]